MQRGDGSVVPLLWQDSLVGSGAAAFGMQTDWHEAYEDGSTEVEPVAFFCSSCAATYEARRTECGAGMGMPGGTASVGELCIWFLFCCCLELS